jgi:hypothetical protein
MSNQVEPIEFDLIMPKTKAQTEEHPIIFSGWSVRRILAGEKTQSRRIVKPQPPEDADKLTIGSGSGTGGFVTQDGEAVYTVGIENCPYGKPGAKLWVREAFRLPAPYDGQPPSFYCELPVRPRKYVADGAYMTNKEVVGTKPIEWGRKRPSIHMPRKLCRLRLRVEEVRVERVQEITMHDLFAEGMTDKGAPPITMNDPENRFLAVRENFAEMWNDIHGNDSWEENPWVWVISFSKLDK